MKRLLSIYVLFQLVIVGSFACRMLLAHFLALSDHELYHYFNMKHLSEGVVHEIPLYIYFLLPTNWIDADIVLRLPSVILFSLSLYVFFYLGKKLFNSKVALISLISLHAIPLSLGLGVLSMSQGLLLFFSLCFWVLCRYYYEEQSLLSVFCLGIGIVIGTALSPLFIMSFIIVVYYMRSSLKTLKQMLGSILTLAMAILIFSFLFSYMGLLQGSIFNVFVNSEKNVMSFMDQMRLSLLLISPWMFWAILGLVLWSLLTMAFKMTPTAGVKEAFVWTIVFLPFGIFWSGRAELLLDAWTLVLAPIVFLSSYCLVEFFKGWHPWRVLSGISVGMSFVFVGFLILTTELGLSDIVPKGVQDMKFVQTAQQEYKHLFSSHRGYKKFAESWLRNQTDPIDFIFTPTWKESSHLSYEMKRPVYSFDIEKELYSSLLTTSQFLGKVGYYITEEYPLKDGAALSKHFKSIQYLKEIKIHRHHKTIRNFFIYRCEPLILPFYH